MGRISSTNRNFLIAYILLVGLPLLGLVGVLRAGRRVSAPISVDGAWKLESASAISLSQPCAKSIASLQDSTMAISQSGRSLVLTLNSGANATGQGVIEGTAISGTIPLNDGPAEDSACGKNSVLTLTGNIDPKAEPRSLTGIIVVDGCSSCATMNYRAVRQSSPVREKIH